MCTITNDRGVVYLSSLEVLQGALPGLSSLSISAHGAPRGARGRWYEGKGSRAACPWSDPAKFV